MLLWWICSTVCDYTSLIKYLYATWCGNKPLECSYVLPWINIVVFYQIDIVLVVMENYSVG
jgi:hypothetical protein